MPAKGPNYDFWARCWFCNEQKVHVANEYDDQYGDEGTSAITGGLCCPRCDLTICHGCSQLYETRIRCRSGHACEYSRPRRCSANRSWPAPSASPTRKTRFT